MTLRHSYQLLSTALALLSLGLGVLLVLVVGRMVTMAHELRETVVATDRVHELQSFLLTYNFQSNIYLRTGDAESNVLREATRERLGHQLSTMPEHIRQGESERLLAEAARHIDRYLQLRDEGESGGRPADEIIGDTTPHLNAALSSMQLLLDLKLRRAAAAERSVSRWAKGTILVGLLTVAFLLLAVGIMLFFIGRRVVEPLARISEAILAYTRERDIRAPVSGPPELQNVAKCFNDLADQLARQEEARLQFLAGATHDLRNPLTPLIAYSSMIDPTRPLPSEEQLRRAFAIINREARRMNRMVGDLLEAARIGAGKLELRLETCDVAKLAVETAELFHDVSPTHAIVAEQGAPVCARCDETRIGQVLTNLVNNAIKYSPEGGTVSVRAGADDGNAWIAVADEGLGISEEGRRHLFDLFWREENVAERIPGAGIGLAVAQRIVKAHGGHIEVESELNKGSTFTIYLPLADHETASAKR